MEVTVVGMGYVGIPTAALFAGVEGFNVIGVQRSSERSGWKIDYLNSGKSPIGGDEPGLAELIERVVKKGSLRVTDDFSFCMNADAIIVTVQTPVDEKFVPQHTSLKEVSKKVGECMKEGVLVSIESTVAPGTTEYVVKPMLEKHSRMKAGEDFSLVYSYERVMVGRLLHNMIHMPRIVGGFTPGCAKRGINLYRYIVEAELIPTDCLTAEVAKVVENTYRDTNIALANEVALICESLGVDIHEVRRLVNSLPFDPSDPAKNPYRMLHIPGAGVGGHCLPKDPWLLKHGLDMYGNFKFTPTILVESRRINDYMPQHMKDLITEALHERRIELKDARICILGLAYLANSDDTRNSPALALYNLLKDSCKEVIVHDPFVKKYGDIALTNSLEDAFRNKDCIALVTNHKEYMKIDLGWLKKLLATPVIVDGRSVFDRKESEKAGYTFRGIGIGKRKKAE